MSTTDESHDSQRHDTLKLPASEHKLGRSSSIGKILKKAFTVKKPNPRTDVDLDWVTGPFRACPTDPALIREYLIDALIALSLKSASSTDGVVDLTNHVTRGRLVSSGGYGDIYIASWKPTTSPTKPGANGLPTLAVKVMRVASLQEEGREASKTRRVKQLKREVQVWQHLKHPNILPLVGIACLDGDPNFSAIVSPWMDKGTIIDYIKTEQSAPIIEYMSDIVSGLDYLHHFSPQIIHGDMKGANVLVDREGRLYICDFGLSSMTLDASLWDTSATHAGGSTRWMAPELLDGKQSKPTTASDIYAYAMTCFEILTREVPFSALRMDGAVATAVVVRNERPSRDLILDVSDSIWGIITRCWATDPKRRPSSTAIVSAMKIEHQRTQPVQFVESHVINTELRFGLIGLASSPVDTNVAAVSSNTFSVWDLAGSKKTTLSHVEGHQGRFRCLAYSQSGTMIATGGEEGVELWYTLGLSNKFGVLTCPSSVHCVAFSPDGTWLAAGMRDGQLQMWKTSSGEGGFVLQGRSSLICSIAISRKGHTLASADSFGTEIVLWDVRQRCVLNRLRPEQHLFPCTVSFSPLDETLVAGYDNGLVTLWDTSSCQQIRSMKLHDDIVTSVVFCPFGRIFASASYDKIIKVTCARTGNAIGPPLAGHNDSVRSVAFSSDGKIIISGSYDMTIRI